MSDSLPLWAQYVAAFSPVVAAIVALYLGLKKPREEIAIEYSCLKYFDHNKGYSEWFDLIKDNNRVIKISNYSNRPVYVVMIYLLANRALLRKQYIYELRLSNVPGLIGPNHTHTYNVENLNSAFDAFVRRIKGDSYLSGATIQIVCQTSRKKYYESVGITQEMLEAYTNLGPPGSTSEQSHQNDN